MIVVSVSLPPPFNFALLRTGGSLLWFPTNQQGVPVETSQLVDLVLKQTETLLELSGNALIWLVSEQNF